MQTTKTTVGKTKIHRKPRAFVPRSREFPAKKKDGKKL